MKVFQNWFNAYFWLLFVLALSLSALAETSPNGIIGFLIDWGETDYFVGNCKGIILTVNPDLKLVDISHGVTSFNIQEGANTLLYATWEFVAATLFLAIVDLRVGTERKPLLLMT